MIYILVLFFLIMTILTYKLFKGEIANPAFIYCFMYFISSFCTMCNVKEWNIHLANKTFLILFIGTIEFVAVVWLVEKLFRSKCTVEHKNEEFAAINKYIMALLIVYSIVVIALTIYNVLKIADAFGTYNSFTQAQALFKAHTSYSNDASLPHYLSLMFKLLELSSYYCIIAYVKYVVYSDRKEKKRIIVTKLYYLIPCLLYIIKELICSSRISILSMCVGAVTIAIILWSQKKNWKSRIAFKNIGIIVAVGVVGMVLFYLSASLIGRSNDKNLFKYVTTYAGGSIECLNHYVIFPIEGEKSDIVGNETFYTLLQSLDKYKITHTNIAEKQTAHLSFRYYYDSMIGNVYTAYRRWHHDFGWIGIIVLNGIMAAVFAVGYYIHKYKPNMKFNELITVVYMYLAYCVYMHCIDSYFYTTVFQITFITNFVIFTILYFILYKSKLAVIEKPAIEEKCTDGKINVLMILPGLNVCGGMESFIMNYYRNIDKDKFQFDFLVHNIGDNSYADEVKSLGGNIYKMPPFGLKTLKQIKNEYIRIIKSKKYHIVHCNMANAAFIYLKYAEKYGVPVRILHSHQNKVADQLSHAIRNIPLIFWGKDYANCNVACSNQAGDYLFGKNNYGLISNCIDYDNYAFDINVRQQARQELRLGEAFVIGNTGRLCPQKNQSFLLDIFKEYIKLNPDTKLLIVGEGEDEEKLKSKADEYGISEKVIFTGARADINRLLQAMDIFVFPSLYEGLGISVLEAQASGLYSLCSLGVPKTAQISELFERMDLKQDASIWSKEIDTIHMKQTDRNNVVLDNKYDVKKCSSELSELYVSEIKTCI